MGARPASVRGEAHLALLLAASVALSGCEIVEANVQALHTLSRSDATEEEKTYAGLVVGGTLAVLTALAVAGTVAAAGVSVDDPPPEHEIVDELGWDFRRDADGASWNRCTSRLVCTHERITEASEDVLEVVPAGRGTAVAMGGVVEGDVDLVAVRVKRRR